HIVMPIFNRDSRELAGAVLVGRPETADDLDERDFELVSSLVSQISITLENQRLFRQVASEQQILQSIIDTTPAAIVVVNPSLTIQVTNSQARKTLGEDFIPGRNLKEIIRMYRARTHEPYPQEELPILLALEHGQTFSAEDLMVRRSDHTLDLLSRAAPLKDEDGNITGAVAVYQDITELRELERALQESLSETTKLYDASRAISRANDIQSISEAIVNQMQVLSPSKMYITLQQQNRRGEITTSLVGVWPETDYELTLDNIEIPRSIIVPDRSLGMANFTFATRNIQTVPGITQEEAARLRANGVNALVVMPLDVRNQYFGSIIAIFADERTFTPDERRFLLTLADQAAIALDAVLLFESTQEALQSTANLYRASRSIAEAQDIHEALEVLQAQIQMLEPDRIDVI
ncbi:MAG: GAF domain-containing protein, partial [Anaerolineae bacterium]|nr:GAF domain-containing protein [Anaerolineae bacterium]